VRQSSDGLLLGESLVRARQVVKACERGHEASEVSLAKDENVSSSLRRSVPTRARTPRARAYYAGPHTVTTGYGET
jgi:hypothetical protein